MRKRNRQILSLILSAALAITSFSMPAYAEEINVEEAVSENSIETEWTDSDETEEIEETEAADVLIEESVEDTENEQMLGEETEESSYEAQESAIPVPGVYEHTWENLTYIYTGSVLTIGGTGQMPEYDFSLDEDGNPEYDKYPWSGYKDSVKSVIVGDGVTSISNGAFSGFELLRTVELGKGLQSIGENAFFMDENLQSIDWGEESSVTTIGEAAFDNCTSLKVLNLPDSVRTIGDYAFDTCEALEEITFGRNVVSVSFRKRSEKECGEKMNVAMT